MSLINKIGRRFLFMLVVGVWVFITLLPTLYLNQKQVDKSFTKTDFIARATCSFGLVPEPIADPQKMAFKSNPSNQVRKGNHCLIMKICLFCFRENLLILACGNIQDIRTISVKYVLGLDCISPRHIC